jgi:hypothetical protein
VRPGLIFTRQGRPKAASSAAFRQRRKIGTGFGRSTRGGFAPVKAAGWYVDVLSRRKNLKGTGMMGPGRNDEPQRVPWRTLELNV